MRLYCLFTVLLLSLPFGLYGHADTSYSSVTKDGRGAIASVHPIATQVGLDVFKQGGNAIDAALAVAFTLGVVDSSNSGIGGGCFILARLANGKIIAIDGREMAPSLATKDMFVRDGKAVSSLSKTGALAIGVPGSIAALHELQAKSGKLKFVDVLLPAAKIAEEGFEINAAFSNRLSRTDKKLSQFEASKAIFLPKGVALKEGERLVQKDLAKTYRSLASQGPEYFYKGAFAKSVDDWMKDNGGIVSKADFAGYHTVVRTPIKSTFLGYDVVGFPPPSSGGVHVAQILSMLEMLDIKNKTEEERYHLIIEASKLAFADRAYWLGDADFAPVPLGLLDQKYLQSRANKIDIKKASYVDGHGLPPNYESLIFDKHTTHLTTADKDGNWVAITTTLNTSFGSGVTIPGTGVLMNNQMDDFSALSGVPNAFGLVGAEANAVAPKKRPLSSMSPTLVLKNGEPVLTVGAAGGPTIISQVAQTTLNYLLFDTTLEEAMKAVRVHHQWKPDRVFIDDFASKELQQCLIDKGHNVQVRAGFGATQAIALRKGEFSAESEPRIQ